jgi:hypothetical protein
MDTFHTYIVSSSLGAFFWSTLRNQQLKKNIYIYVIKWYILCLRKVLVDTAVHMYTNRKLISFVCIVTLFLN